MDWLTRGWWSKHMPAFPLPEKVALTFDTAAALKEAFDIAIVVGAPLLREGELLAP